MHISLVNEEANILETKEEEKDRYFSSPSSIVIQRQHLPNASVIGDRRSYLNALLKTKPSRSAKQKNNVKSHHAKKSKFDKLLNTVNPLMEVMLDTF